jgi:hypothetical protein
MQRPSECKFRWCNFWNNLNIFALRDKTITHVDCYTLLFLLSRSGYFAKYGGRGNLIANIIWPPSVAGNLNDVIFLALNFTQFIAWLKNSWLKNYCYSFVTGVTPRPSWCPPLLLSSSFISVWYAAPSLCGRPSVLWGACHAGYAAPWLWCT